MNQNIAIVGSGFLGMTLAIRYADAGANVTLYESAAEIGGLASVWEIGGIVWDKHYHVVLASDRHTRNIIEEIGLGDEFSWVETKTGFYTDGKLESMSDTMEFLTFPPLDLISKLRLGATIFYASRVKDWKRLEKVTAEEWLTKLSGKKTFEKIWKPLLKAKLGEAYKETAASFIWASIQRMYSARNSGMKREMFGYVRGGYARVLKRFEEVLVEKGVEIRLNAKVGSIERLETGQVRVTTAAARRNKDEKQTVLNRKVEYASAASSSAVAVSAVSASRLYDDPALSYFDKVILTCPSNAAEKMLGQLDPKERKMLQSIRYQGIVCASVMMKASLSKYYVTNITDDTPFTGIIEMTAIVDKEEFNRDALVYLPRYVAPDDELFDKTDDEIEEYFLGSLEKMYSHFHRKDVTAFKISRVRQVFPIPVLRYSEGLSAMKTSVDGVYIVNSSHIVNGTLNINETVQLAEKFFAEDTKAAGN